MKKIALLLCTAMVMCNISGCANKQLTEARNLAEQTRIVSAETLLWSSSATRPEWILEEPEVTDRGMAFIGLSAKYSTEQQAREDARRNATLGVARFMGEVAKDKFERARISFGLDSNSIDATESSRVYEKLAATNLVAGLKVAKWYEEKWQTPTGIAWKAYALTSVPIASLDQSFRATAASLASDAERRAKEAGNRLAQQQAEKAAQLWKQLEDQGVLED